MRDLREIEEEWRVIENWPDYAVSSFGRIKRLTTRTCAKAGHVLKAVPRSKRSSGGYPSVDLCRAGKKRTEMVHLLVARAFLGPVPEGHEVNHLDGYVSNPRLNNLEYTTSSKNQIHAYALGLQDARGEQNGQAKLTPVEVLHIRELAIGAWGEQTRLAQRYGVSATAVRDIIARRTWTHI